MYTGESALKWKEETAVNSCNTSQPGPVGTVEAAAAALTGGTGNIEPGPDCSAAPTEGG